MKKGKDIITIPVFPGVPTPPSIPSQDWWGRPLGQPCLIERFLESLPPEKRSGAATMISCPCPKCSPYSLG